MVNLNSLGVVYVALYNCTVKRIQKKIPHFLDSEIVSDFIYESDACIST